MLKIEPIFSEKIWGSSKLKKLGFDIPKNKKIGEAWIISAYKDNSSKIKNGESLRDFYKNNKNLFNNYNSDEFPLLVKILDANDHLSIQVHPNDEMAMELEKYPFGKTECWYVLETKNNNDIVIGTTATSKDEARKLIKENKWDEFLKTTPIEKDCLFDIKAGTVHAIKSGTLIYELQQSSDITYRLYDYDRVDANGEKRELQIEKSIKVIDYDSKDHKKEPILKEKIGSSRIYSMISNDLFILEKWIVNDELNTSVKKNERNFLLITVIYGNANINGKKFNKYESGIITSDELKKISISGNATILVGSPK